MPLYIRLFARFKAEIKYYIQHFLESIEVLYSQCIVDNFGGSSKPVLLISLFFIFNCDWPISSSILACSVKAWCNREMCRVVFSSILSLRSLPPCTSEQFACADGTSCIPKSWLCTGYGGCNDLSHILPSQCDDCAADHLFKCRNNGVDLCLNRAYPTRCDGLIHCGNLADELISECPNCVGDPSMFTCKKNGLEICLKKSYYQCSGYPDCE